MFSIEMIGLYNTAIVVTLQNAVVAVQDTLTLEPVTKVSVVHFSDLTAPLWWSRSFIIWPVWISHTLQGGQGVRHMFSGCFQQYSGSYSTLEALGGLGMCLQVHQSAACGHVTSSHVSIHVYAHVKPVPHVLRDSG